MEHQEEELELVRLTLEPAKDMGMLNEVVWSAINYTRDHPAACFEEIMAFAYEDWDLNSKEENQ